MTDTSSVDAFVEAASVPIGSAHASGGLDDAERLRLVDPDVARRSMHAAAVLGDTPAVREWIDRDRTLATAPGGPRNWPPLVYLCFSRYLRLDPTRGDAFVDAARLLLEAGADANGGFFASSYSDRPEWECVLYGAAGIAHHEGLTRLLLAHGADPNDGEVTYHAGETYDLGVVRALLDTGRLTPDSLGVLLVRKHDWHDLDGVRLLLDHGANANPNIVTGWGITPLHQAVRRDNSAAIVQVLLERGADPTIPLRNASDHAAPATVGNALTIAAWRGRADLLSLFEAADARFVPPPPQALVAACARGDLPAATALAADNPAQLEELTAYAGEVLSLFAGNGNVDGIRCLGALGLSVAAVWPEGDGYFEIPRNSTALHVAAWRAQHEAVRTLIDMGAPVNLADGAGRAPLALAVRACVSSWWQWRRRPDSIAALLAAGADATVIALPTGYDEADVLLREARRGT